MEYDEFIAMTAEWGKNSALTKSEEQTPILKPIDICFKSNGIKVLEPSEILQEKEKIGEKEYNEFIAMTAEWGANGVLAKSQEQAPIQKPIESLNIEETTEKFQPCAKVDMEGSRTIQKDVNVTIKNPKVCGMNCFLIFLRCG